MKFIQNKRRIDWATSFEALRTYNANTALSLRAGKIEKSWKVLQCLALSCPHFILDQSKEYSETRLAEKLSVHLLHALWGKSEKAALVGVSKPMFTAENGDELMVRAAQNWSPRERFHLNAIEATKEDWELIDLLRILARNDHIFFDALELALDFVSEQTRHLEPPALILRSELLNNNLMRPIRKLGKKPSPKTVYRRLATRLFLHEMNELGFEIGSSRAKPTGDKATDAAHEALHRYGHNPPSVGTLLEDWNSWNFKGT